MMCVVSRLAEEGEGERKTEKRYGQDGRLGVIKPGDDHEPGPSFLLTACTCRLAARRVGTRVLRRCLWKGSVK